MHDAFAAQTITEEGQKKAEEIRTAFDDCRSKVLAAMNTDGRYPAMVTTKLEEACLLAVKGMALKNVSTPG